jgi:IS30 family transposase
MSYSHLSSEERYVITYLVLNNLSLREIARQLNRHHTSISRILGDVLESSGTSLTNWTNSI